MQTPSQLPGVEYLHYVPSIVPTGYLDRIKKARDHFVIFFDVMNNRGWLIDAASALLHLVLSSLERDRLDIDLRRFYKFKLADMESLDPNQNHAVAVLMDEKNTSAILHHQSTHKFEDRVNSIWSVLDIAFDHQDKIDRIHNNHFGLLEGFEFKDIVTSEVKEIRTCIKKLHPGGLNWVGLTRKLNAVTVFGHEFAHLIEPTESTTVCSHGGRVPSGRSYLAACVSDLKKLSSVCRYMPDKVFEQSECQNGSGVCSKTKTLLSEGDDGRKKNGTLRRIEDLDEFPLGALIFGDVSEIFDQVEHGIDELEVSRGSSTSAEVAQLPISTSSSTHPYRMEDSSGTEPADYSRISHDLVSPNQMKANLTPDNDGDDRNRGASSRGLASISPPESLSRQTYSTGVQETAAYEKSQTHLRRRKDRRPAQNASRDEHGPKRVEQDVHPIIPRSKSILAAILFGISAYFSQEFYYRVLSFTACFTSLWIYLIWVRTPKLLVPCFTCPN